MSQSQFADAITSLNMGDGVPCTIMFTERDGYMPACDFVSKIEQFRGEFSDHLSGIKDNLDENIKAVEEILETRKTLRNLTRKLFFQLFIVIDRILVLMRILLLIHLMSKWIRR